MSVPETVARFRQEYRATEIERWYSGWAHFAFTSVGSLAVITYAIHRVEAPTLAELAVAPIGFLIANAAEYFGHKGPMHHPGKILGLLHRRHTLQHHRFFTRDAMAYESTRDFKMVLFPPVMLFFFLGCLAGPIGLLLFLLASHNAGWIFVATGMSYFLTYEWLHWAYHMRADSWVGRLPFIATLRRHHTTHHDPLLMSRKNFNITFPICDALFGTRHVERAPAVKEEAMPEHRGGEDVAR